jgi:hypothetical protein
MNEKERKMDGKGKRGGQGRRGKGGRIVKACAP